MQIKRASEADLQSILALFRSARRLHSEISYEDMPTLLAKSDCVVGNQDGVLWGFLGLQTEERPDTLPPEAPTRTFLRAMALRGGYSESEYANLLLVSAMEQLRKHGTPAQVITYGGESWLFSTLNRFGFTVTDQVQFFELLRPHMHLNHIPAHSAVKLVPVNPSQLGSLAILDADAFPPLWHFGRKDMVELLMRSHLQAAMEGDRLVGYSAAIANSSEELQLARIAVHPDRQAHGIGCQLLCDVIEYAAANRFERVILNTQTDNERSRRLYLSCGFRPLGKPAPVLTMTIEESEAVQP